MNLDCPFQPDWDLPQSGNLIFIADLSDFASLTATHWLSDTEKERYPNMANVEHQQHYLQIRFLLRLILAAALKKKPDQFQFLTSPFGKPVLANEAIHFNLTHSQHWLAIMLSKQPCGVDIEITNQKRNYSKLIQRFFTQEEARYFDTNTTQNELFFEWWTTKEAVLKAHGQGISAGLDKINLCQNTHSLNQKDYSLEHVQFTAETCLSSAIESHISVLTHYFLLTPDLEITPLTPPYRKQLHLTPERI